MCTHPNPEATHKGPTVCAGFPVVSCAPTGTGTGVSSSADSTTVETGNANPQVENGVEIDGNVCGGDMSCP